MVAAFRGVRTAERGRYGSGMSAQLSLFSVGVRPPGYADLDGLLAGPGHLVRRGGAARLSIVLGEPAQWRLAGLLAGLAELGLSGEVRRSELGVSVRTPFGAELSPLALRWTVGAHTRAPADLAFDGAGLRWWCLAAGSRDTLGFVLTLRPDEASWGPIGGALAAAGVPGTLVRPRQLDRRSDDVPDQRIASSMRRHRPAFRLVGRRLRRLAELVGPAPAGAPADGWPGG